MRDWNNTSHNFDESPDPWAQIITEIIDSPPVKDSSDNDLVRVKWIINGKILLTTTDLIEP
jgi:hypothetical protein